MFNQNNNTLHWIIFGFGAFVIIGFLYWLNPLSRVSANPSTISQPGVGRLSTASASSTPTFMTPGVATTTLTLDAINGTATTTLTPLTSVGVSNAVAVNEAWLGVQMVGSSTASLLRVDWEYSNDGIDFYRDYATSTVITYASSTPRGIGGQSETALPAYLNSLVRTHSVLIEVPKIPARYVRAVLSVPSGSLNSTNWAQFITRQER